MRRALIGHTGFVGTSLKGQASFDGLFNSSNIDEIAGASFDLAVCAGAPATMWLANKDPEADRANLERLAERIAEAKIGHLILISSIAVLDHAGAGYTETTAQYQDETPYGKHRRALETALIDALPSVQIVRLPALFGPGLKKNFIFDLINPAPSFLKPDAMERLRGQAKGDDESVIDAAYSFDDGVGMWRLDRDGVAARRQGTALEEVIEAAGMPARFFTNAQSRFQYYDMRRLWNDLETVRAAAVPTMHMAPEPVMAATVCRHLTGRDFVNDGPPQGREDMRTENAALLGGEGAYIVTQSTVLDGLKSYYEAA